MILTEPKRDTGRFSTRQWYVPEFPNLAFTTKEDAEEAVRLAGLLSTEDRKEIRERMEEALGWL